MKDFSKKKIIIFGIVGVLVIALAVGAILFINSRNNHKDDVVLLTEDEIYALELKKTISMDFNIGETKESIAEKLGLEVINEDHLTLNDYYYINEEQYLPTLLFSDGKLDAIVYEKWLSITDKENIVVDFQHITSDMNRAFSKLDLSFDWLNNNEKKYDEDVWAKEIIGNNLEMKAKLTDGTNDVYIIASGIPYFDYLSNKVEATTFGNFAIVYTAKEFWDISSLTK